MEDLIIIKENKAKIVEFKERGGYNLIRNDRNPFSNITVEEVIANLEEEEELEETERSAIFDQETG